MPEAQLSPLIRPLVGQVVVIDLRSSYVCLGRLVGYDDEYFELHDADLHDFRDSRATREVYVYESKRLGIRRNRQRVFLRRDEVVAVALFDEVVEN